MGTRRRKARETKQTGEHEIVEQATNTTFDPVAKQNFRDANITRREARSFSYLGKVRMALIPSIHALQPICVRLAQVAIMPRPPRPISRYHGFDLYVLLALHLGRPASQLRDGDVEEFLAIINHLIWLRARGPSASSQQPLIHGEGCNCEECIATTAEFSDGAP